MRVRAAVLSDVPRIVEIENLCFPDETAFPAGMFVFLVKNARTLVAYDDFLIGFVIGYASGRTGIIYTLDVHPSHQGKGIGRLLLSEMESVLYHDGARRCRLESALTNSAAMGLYSRIGYRPKELLRDYYGFDKHAVRLWKDLEDGSKSSCNVDA